MTEAAEATAPTTPFDHAERRIWSGKAEAYADTYAHLCAHPAEALLDAAEVGPGARVLDVGCGSGTVSAAAVARGASVYAADGEPGMVAATRRAVPGVTAHIARLPELPYANDTFDAVVGNFVLNHVGRPLAALAELRRITRPGGRGAVTIWRVPGAPGQTLIGRAAQAAGLTRPAWLPALAPQDDFPRTPEGLAALLDAAGRIPHASRSVGAPTSCAAGGWRRVGGRSKINNGDSFNRAGRVTRAKRFSR
ncbi:class I SAM-dependent methyltransferase [Streptomyces rubiginosohelvolus]